MKKIIYLTLLCAFMFSCSNEVVQDPLNEEGLNDQETYDEENLLTRAQTRSSVIELNDYWSSKLTDHMLTTVRNDAAHARYYRYCGVLARALSEPMEPYTTPLYSYWNCKKRDHYYTTTPMSYSKCKKNKYQYTGILCYVFKEQIAGTIPVYEYYHKCCVDHFYTTSRDQEYSHYKNGYKYQGIAFYAYPESAPPI